MELSSDVLIGLQAAGSSVVTDQVFRDLVHQAVEDSINPAGTGDLKSKQVFHLKFLYRVQIAILPLLLPL